MIDQRKNLLKFC